MARAAGVTIGALYHHFGNKTERFAAVFEHAHLEVLEGYARAAARGKDDLDSLVRAIDDFLDAVLDAEICRIMITDAPSVPGLERFTELDEK